MEGSGTILEFIKNGARDAAESSIAAFAKKCKPRDGKKGRKTIIAETEGRRRGERRERKREKRTERTEELVQVTGLDLRTVGAGKPRGEEETSKDKIEVESM